MAKNEKAKADDSEEEDEGEFIERVLERDFGSNDPVVQMSEKKNN